MCFLLQTLAKIVVFYSRLALAADIVTPVCYFCCNIYLRSFPVGGYIVVFRLNFFRSTMTSADVAQVVVEFYTTNDEGKRKQLHDWLLHAQKGPNAWQIALDLLQADKPHTVQYFAANCLYDTVTKRWEECMSSAEMVRTLFSSPLYKGFQYKV